MIIFKYKPDRTAGLRNLTAINGGLSVRHELVNGIFIIMKWGTYLSLSYEERFKSLYEVNEVTGCWDWKQKYARYGRFKYNGITYLAHRLSYEWKYGAIPEGLLACHTCDNNKCVNPDHIFLGTQKDNMDDAGRKGRRRIAICPSHRMYSNGCRCELCVKFHRVANLKYWRNKKYGT